MEQQALYCRNRRIYGPATKTKVGTKIYCDVFYFWLGRFEEAVEAEFVETSTYGGFISLYS